MFLRRLSIHILVTTMTFLSFTMPAMAAPRGITSQTRGHLILIGGGSKPLPVLEKFVLLAGGKDASIVIFPTASGEPDTGDYYLELFTKQLGCTRLQVLEVRKREDGFNLEYTRAVLEAGGVFFSGGDQSRITTRLLDTPVGKAVDQVYRNGAVIGGTSAGTACMSAVMMTGNGKLDVIQSGNIELAQGLGLFPGVIVDQHFVARQRQNRLISAILEHPYLVGVGIDEATAIWLQPNLAMTVLGEGWVVVYDASSAHVTHRKIENGAVHQGATDVKLHILQPGQVYDIKTRKVIDKK